MPSSQRHLMQQPRREVIDIKRAQHGRVEAAVNDKPAVEPVLALIALNHLDQEFTDSARPEFV